MLKKYFYISILLGLFALSGCTDDKVDTTKTEEELKQVWELIPKEWQPTFKKQVAKQKESLNK